MNENLHEFVCDRITQSITLLYNTRLITREKRDQSLDELQCNLDLDISANNNACIIKKPTFLTTTALSSKLVLRLSESVIQTNAYPVYHEIAHFLSIGELEFDGHEYIRRWGICSTKYSIICGSVHTHIDKRLYKMNEALNDCVGRLLYQYFISGDLPISVLNRTNKYSKYGDSIIRLYLSNNTYGILALLESDNPHKWSTLNLAP